MNMSHHELNIKANERVPHAETCCLDEQPVWVMTLPQVQWGINHTPHQAATTTQFRLLFNTKPRGINGDYVDNALAKEFDRGIEARQTSAVESTHEDQRKQQARYNKKHSQAPTYEPGDVVLVERANSVWRVKETEGKIQRSVRHYGKTTERPISHWDDAQCGTWEEDVQQCRTSGQAKAMEPGRDRLGRFGQRQQ